MITAILSKDWKASVWTRKREVSKTEDSRDDSEWMQHCKVLQNCSQAVLNMAIKQGTILCRPNSKLNMSDPEVRPRCPSMSSGRTAGPRRAPRAGIVWPTWPWQSGLLSCDLPGLSYPSGLCHRCHTCRKSPHGLSSHDLLGVFPHFLLRNYTWSNS